MKIKDLKESKELDSKQMADVVGGTGAPAFLANFGSPVNGPKLADLMAIAQSSTGLQSNTNAQSDNDYNVVIGNGQVINHGGNTNWTTQNAISLANNDSASAQ